MKNALHTLRDPAGALRGLFGRRREPRSEPEGIPLEALVDALDGYLFGASVEPRERSGVGFLHVELEGCPSWIMVPEPGLAVAWHEAKTKAPGRAAA